MCLGSELEVTVPSSTVAAFLANSDLPPSNYQSVEAAAASVDVQTTGSQEQGVSSLSESVVRGQSASHLCRTSPRLGDFDPTLENSFDGDGDTIKVTSSSGLNSRGKVVNISSLQSVDVSSESTARVPSPPLLRRKTPILGQVDSRLEKFIDSDGDEIKATSSSGLKSRPKVVVDKMKCDLCDSWSSKCEHCQTCTSTNLSHREVVFFFLILLILFIVFFCCFCCSCCCCCCCCCICCICILFVDNFFR